MKKKHVPFLSNKFLFFLHNNMNPFDFTAQRQLVSRRVPLPDVLQEIVAAYTGFQFLPTSQTRTRYLAVDKDEYWLDGNRLYKNDDFLLVVDMQIDDFQVRNDEYVAINNKLLLHTPSCRIRAYEPHYKSCVCGNRVYYIDDPPSVLIYRENRSYFQYVTGMENICHIACINERLTIGFMDGTARLFDSYVFENVPDIYSIHVYGGHYYAVCESRAIDTLRKQEIYFDRLLRVYQFDWCIFIHTERGGVIWDLRNGELEYLAFRSTFSCASKHSLYIRLDDVTHIYRFQ